MNELLGKIVVIKRNGSDGPHFPLRTNECLFGRKPECDIRIQLPNVSQEHAIIRVDNDKKIRLVNLSSCNQTLVNGKPVDTAEVQHLDVFTISDRSFRFEFPSPTPKAIKSPKKQRRHSIPSPKSGQENKTPKMPTSKGSPRTPQTGGSLKERIHYMRRNSMPLQEEEEGSLSSPAVNKTPLGTMAMNLQEFWPNGIQKPAEDPIKGEVQTKTRKHSKRVSFGPVLSPEQFDKSLPPATPVRRGATPKRPSSSSEVTGPDISSALTRRSVGVSPWPTPIVEEEDMESLVTEEAPQKNETPKSQRRLSLRIAAKSPRLLELRPESVNGSSDVAKVQSNNVIEQTACSSIDEDDGVSNDESYGGGDDDSDDENDGSSNDDDIGDISGNNEQDETAVLDSDNYTSDEESELEQKASINFKELATPACEEMKKGVELQETKAKRKLATPVRNEIKEGVKLRETKKKLATPIREEIQEGFKLPETKKKMATPVRNEIQAGFKLRETKKKLATPVRDAIQAGFKLRETKKKLATPVRDEIQEGFKLRETKKKLATPVRYEIQEGFKLRETKKKLATPVRNEIQEGFKLRETKKKLATPVRDEIQAGFKLRETKKKLATPVRDEIQEGFKLRETKKKLATPVRKEIQEGFKLRETKKKLATPVRNEILEGFKLRETKKKLATPVRNEIQEGSKLRETKKKLATPVRNEILEGFQLRETKKKLATPVRKEIRKGIKLRETKKKLLTPLKKELQGGIELKETKRKLATPLRSDIKLGVKLKQTKMKLSTPLRKAIQKRPSLKPTKKRMVTPIRAEIESRPSLRQTKKVMNSVLQSEIMQGAKLKKTKKMMPLELQIEITKGKTLKKTVKKLPTPLRKVIAEGVTLRNSKKSLPTPVRAQIREGTVLQKTKKSLPTPVRNQIEEGSELRQLKKKMVTPLRKAIQDGVSLKATKRRLSETELNVKPPKKPRTMPTADSFEEAEGQFMEEHAPVRIALKTPLRKAIASGVQLRITRHRMCTPLRSMIHAKPTLRAVRRKSGVTTALTERATRRPTYADVERRSKLTGVRRSSRGPSFEFGKTAQQFNKAECGSPSTISVSTATSTTENPKSPVLQTQERRRSTRTSTRLQIKKRSLVESAELNESLTGVPELFATPLAESNSVLRPKSSWMSSLARAANGPKTRRKSVDDDFEGLSTMFATPPAAETRPTRSSSKPKQPGNWLSSLAIATNGPHRRTNPVEDLQGVAEMFATPPLSDKHLQEPRRSTRKRSRAVRAATAPSVSCAGEEFGFKINSTTPKSMPGLVIDASSPEPKFQKLEALDPNTSGVKTGTPIQTSRKPSLRSAQKQEISTVASRLPTKDLENVEALNLSKTPCLRSSDTDVLNVEMVSPIQSSRTPSLRSAKKQAISAVASPIPSNHLENVEALNPSKTPSLRNADSDALNVEMVSPIQSSRTPSLRSAKKQAICTVASPLPTKDLENVEALDLSKTPSLRNADTDTLNVEMVSPIQSSRTPSLRSAKKQEMSTVASPLPTKDLENVEALDLSKTPSLRNADTDALNVEMVSPIQSSRTPSLKSAKKQAICTVASPLATKDLENVEALDLSKTPSLRNTDALNVEMVSPIQSSRTPSLKSAKKQAICTVASPLATKDLENVEALDLSKTPSLRNADTDALNVEVVSPIQSSRTPSLRSVTNQVVITSASRQPLCEGVETVDLTKTPFLGEPVEVTSLDQVLVTSIETSRTPSLRSAKKQSTGTCGMSPEPTFEVIQVIEPTISIPSSTEGNAVPQENGGQSSSDRKSFGLTGLARLMKLPRENYAVENPSDLFVPSIFKSPKSERKRLIRNSVGLQGVARLMRTPKGEAALESPRRDGIKRVIQTGADLESPDLTGIKKLMKTPKSPVNVSPERNFVAELFASPGLKINDAATVQSRKQTAKKPMKAVTDVPVERITRRRPAAVSEVLAKRTRAKRCAPEDATQPTPKRTRRTRTEVEKREEDEPDISDSQLPCTKPLKEKRAARGKKRKTVSVKTPKRFLFHRTLLEPISEIPTPVPNFDVSEGSTSSRSPVVEKKHSKAKGLSKASEPVQEERTPPTQSFRSRTGRSRESKSSREESSDKEALTKQRSTRARKTEKDAEPVSATKETRNTRKAVVKSEEITRKKGEEVPPQVTTRATRSKIAELCSVQNEDVPKQVMTRTTRSRRTQETDIDEQPVSVVPDEDSWNKPTSRRRGRGADTQDAKTARTTHSRAEKNQAEEAFPEPKPTRSTRGGVGTRVGRMANEINTRERKTERGIEAECVESKPKRSLRIEQKIVEVTDQPKISRRTRSNAVEEVVSVSNAAPARKERRTQADKQQVLEADRASSKTSSKHKEQETRSCRRKRVPEQAESLQTSPPKTRGTKRTLQEDAEYAVPSSKRTRSSTRAQTENLRQTRLRARK